MQQLNRNLAFLFLVMVIFTFALFYSEERFPNDGQIFQCIAGILSMAAATFFTAARHTFNIPEEKPDPPAPKTEDKKPEEKPNA